jgi:hypothetical protein
MMFAHNNEKIDYFTIAYINALMVRKHLRVGITLVSDNETITQAQEKYTKEQMLVFDNILIDVDSYQKNSRVYRDSNKLSENLNFKNRNRALAYKLTPYQETILLDSDYLVQSDSLASCWNSNNNVMMNHQTQEVNREQKPYAKFIGDFGIRMYWATVVYFKQSFEAEQFFKIVEQVSKDYDYYRDLYCFPNTMYRNDWAFSVAAHEFSSCQDQKFPELPCPVLLKSFDRDDIVDVDEDSIVCLLQQARLSDKFLLSRVTGIDIHVMNKFSILRNTEKFLEIYE